MFCFIYEKIALDLVHGIFQFHFHFFRNDVWDVRLLFRKGSRDRATVCDELLDWLLCTLVFVGLANRDDVAALAVRVGILEVAAFGWAVAVLLALRAALSLSIFKFRGIGDVRSDTLLRFGNGVTLGELDALLFRDDRPIVVIVVVVGVNFFNCSIRRVGLFI